MSRPSHAGPTPWPVHTAPPASRTLPALIADTSRRTPDHVAISFASELVTYGELQRRITAAAAALHGLGVRTGTQVALMATNSSTWLEVAFGAMRLGAIVHAFNTWARAYDLDHLLAASEAEVLIMVDAAGSTSLWDELRNLAPEAWRAAPSSWHSPRFPHLRHLVGLEAAGGRPSGAQLWSELLEGDNEPGGPDVSQADDVAMVLYTSGSTDRPKAVPMLHADMIDNGFAIGERLGLGPADRVWAGSPLFWSFGIANATMATMTHGATLVLQERFTPESAVATLKANACTAAYLLPSMVEAVIRSGTDQDFKALTELRTGVTIGRPDEVERVIKDLGISQICNVYGSTETYGNCCVTPHWLPAEERQETQGEPLSGVEIRIVRPGTEDVVPVGTEGEIHVRGRIMPGYRGAPALNEGVITAQGWFRTGDHGVLTTAGRLQFRARHTEVIKTSGINVSPADVETFISRHPWVREVAVVGAPDPLKGDVPIAFVVTDDPALDAETLLTFCRDGMASYKIPARIVIVDGLPQTATGKLARKELLSRAAEAHGHTTDTRSTR